MKTCYRIKAHGVTMYFQLPDPVDDQRPEKFLEKTPKQIAREALGPDVRLLELSNEGIPPKMLYSGRTVYGVALLVEGSL